MECPRVQRTYLSKPVAVVAGAISALTAWPSVAVGQYDDEPEPATPRLISEFEGLIPGRVNTLALTFDLDPGWHVYWHGQNDTGFPITAEFEVTGGNWWGEILRPAGKRYVSNGGILDYVYEEDEATLLLPVLLPDSAEPGSVVTVKATAEWLVCREACIPGWGEVEATFRVLEPGATAKAGDGAERIASARARLPKPWTEQNTEVDVRWEGVGTDGEVLVIETKRGHDDQRDGEVVLSFLPDESGRVMKQALKTGERKNGPLRLRFEPGEKPVIGVVRVERRPAGDANAQEAAVSLYKIGSVSPPDDAPENKSSMKEPG